MTAQYSIFAQTMVDMTYPEVEAAIARGAIGLWGLGVVEEHGPHLPLGTDIYLPYRKQLLIRQALESAGVEVLIMPPFYWGVNLATAGFSGTINVRPETMIDLMTDILGSMQQHGLKTAYCITGHLETIHCQTLVRGLEAAKAASGSILCIQCR